jgi:hypothetical protein
LNDKGLIPCWNEPFLLDEQERSLLSLRFCDVGKNGRRDLLSWPLDLKGFGRALFPRNEQIAIAGDRTAAGGLHNVFFLPATFQAVVTAVKMSSASYSHTATQLCNM